MRNPWVNACINVKTNEILNLGFNITDGEDNTETETTRYLTNLLNKPMGYDSLDTYSSLITQTCHTLYGLGDVFIEVISDNTFNTLTGLRFIPTEYMNYYPDTEQFGLRNKPDTRFESDELIHIHEPSIDGSVWGISPIDIIASDLTLELLGRDHTLSILKAKGLYPRGVIEFDKETTDMSFNTQLQRLQAEAEHQKNNTLILKGATYSNTGVSNQDMEYIELMHDTRDRILATYGVPPSKVSIIETASLGTGTGQSQAENFKKVLFSDCKLISDEFNRIFKAYGFTETLSFNELDIENKLERSNIEIQQLTNGVRTINEIREGYGLEPVSWGDTPRNNNSSNLNNELSNTSNSVLTRAYKKIGDWTEYP